MEQVFAEFAACDKNPQIGIRRGNNFDIHLVVSLLAQGSKLLILKDAK